MNVGAVAIVIARVLWLPEAMLSVPGVVTVNSIGGPTTAPIVFEVEVAYSESPE